MKKIMFLLIISLLCACSQSINKENDLLRGQFSYFADAAIFVDCKTQIQYPVAKEGDYLKLEQEYLKNVKDGGEQILVELNGKIEDRKKIEGEGKRSFLIVKKFLNILPNKNCD
jgi:copper homeostasis protein (lipoprotein)